MKFDAVKVLTIVGTVLTLGGSLISSVAGDKKNKEIIAKLVDEKLANK